MSRLRLIDTGKFHRCRHRDLLTYLGCRDRDWAKDVETEALSKVSLISGHQTTSKIKKNKLIFFCIFSCKYAFYVKGIYFHFDLLKGNLAFTEVKMQFSVSLPGGQPPSKCSRFQKCLKFIR